MKTMPPSLPHTLRDLRKRARLTILEAAAAAGVDHRRLSDYELGRRCPTDDALVRLSRLYGPDLALETDLTRPGGAAAWAPNTALAYRMFHPGEPRDKNPADGRELLRILACSCGGDYERTMARIQAREDAEDVQACLRSVSCRSPNEMLTLLLLLADGALPIRPRLSRIGVNELVVVDPRTQRLLGERRPVGLLWGEIVVIPDIHIRFFQQVHRFGFLIGMNVGRRPRWGGAVFHAPPFVPCPVLRLSNVGGESFAAHFRERILAQFSRV